MLLILKKPRENISQFLYQKIISFKMQQTSFAHSCFENNYVWQKCVLLATTIFRQLIFLTSWITKKQNKLKLDDNRQLIHKHFLYEEIPEPNWRYFLPNVSIIFITKEKTLIKTWILNLGFYLIPLKSILFFSTAAENFHTHLFNLHPEKWFEGYPVKSTQIFIGCHLRFIRVASTQIFFRVTAWKKSHL